MNKAVWRFTLLPCMIVLGIMYLTGCSQIDRHIRLNQDENWKYYFEQSTQGDYQSGVDMAKRPLEAVVNKLISREIISENDIQEGYEQGVIYSAPYTFERPGLEYEYFYEISYDGCLIRFCCIFKPIENPEIKTYYFSISVIKQQTVSQDDKLSIDIEKLKPFFDALTQTIQDRNEDSGVNSVTFHDITYRYSAQDLNARIDTDYSYPTQNKSYRQVKDSFVLSQDTDDILLEYTLNYVPGDHDAFQQINGEQVKYYMSIRYCFKLDQYEIIVD